MKITKLIALLTAIMVVGFGMLLAGNSADTIAADDVIRGWWIDYDGKRYHCPPDCGRRPIYPPPPPPPSPQDLSNQAYNRAYRFAEKGKFKEAEKEYLKAIRLNPRNAGAHNNLANIYYKWGWYQKAIEHYKKAMKYDPEEKYRRNLANALLGLGNEYLDQGNLQQAEPHYRSVLGMYPRNPAALNGLGRIFQHREDFDLALDYYRRAMQEGAQYAANNYTNLAAYMAEKRSRSAPTNEAIQLLREYLNVFPEDADRWNILSSRLFEADRLNEAEEAYRMAHKYNPSIYRHPDPHSMFREAYQFRLFGKASELNGQTKVDAMRKIIDLYPESNTANSARKSLAEALVGLGLLDKAEAVLEDALDSTFWASLDNRWDWESEQLRQLYVDKARSERSWLEDYLQFVRNKKVSQSNNLGIALSDQGKHQEAEKVYREGLRQNPKEGALRYNLALSLKRQGRHLEADEVYREGLRQNPKSNWWGYNLALSLKEQGRHKEAETVARRTVELDPDYKYARELLTGIEKYNNSFARRFDPIVDPISSMAGAIQSSAVKSARRFYGMLTGDPNSETGDAHPEPAFEQVKSLAEHYGSLHEESLDKIDTRVVYDRDRYGWPMEIIRCGAGEGFDAQGCGLLSSPMEIEIPPVEGHQVSRESVLEALQNNPSWKSLEWSRQALVSDRKRQESELSELEKQYANRPLNQKEKREIATKIEHRKQDIKNIGKEIEPVREKQKEIEKKTMISFQPIDLSGEKPAHSQGATTDGRQTKR
jgi:tetratricopeptide (TPR) repeat protein